MGSNMLRTEDWPDIVKAIQAGDLEVGARLAERERRFDNYFAYFEYEPLVIQGVAVAVDVGSYIQVQRIGTLVFVVGYVGLNAAGTPGEPVGVQLPPGLPYAPAHTSGVVGGTYDYSDNGTHYVGAPFITSGYVYGLGDVSSAPIGTDPSITTAAADTIFLGYFYHTTVSSLL